MSQRKEKYTRQLDRRMDEAEKKLLELKLEMLDLQERKDASNELAAECSARLKKARQRAAEAECAARLNALALIVVVLAMALLLLAATVMQPEAAAEEPENQAEPVVKAKAIPAEPEDQEAQLFPWANKLENCMVTYYDICEECCGKVDGITSSGAPAVPYETCAVDPAVIPLGSAVTVDYGDGGLHQLRAEDTGGEIKGNHIDICVSSHKEAKELGVKETTVYWLPGY